MSHHTFDPVKDLGDYVNVRTYIYHEASWFQSLGRNMPRILAGRNVADLPKVKGPAVVVGAGPSMDECRFIDVLKTSDFKGTVVCADKMLIPLLKAGVKVDYVVTVDGAPIITSFYDHELVNKSGVKAIMILNVHPSVLEKFQGEVYWFTPIYEDPRLASIACPKCQNVILWPFNLSRALHFISGKMLCSPLGNSGAFATISAVHMEAKPVIILGIDFSYGEKVKPEDTPYWKPYLQQVAGKPHIAIKQFYEYKTNPWGRTVLTDLIFKEYREVLLAGIKSLKTEIINPNPLSIVFGEYVKIIQPSELPQYLAFK